MHVFGYIILVNLISVAHVRALLSLANFHRVRQIIATLPTVTRLHIIKLFALLRSKSEVHLD